MNKYDHFSDAQINSKVKYHLLGKNASLTDWDFSRPSDAWPIIVLNKISVLNIDDSWEARSDVYEDDYEEQAYCYSHKSVDPLRAAMIVFLIMKDSENG